MAKYLFGNVYFYDDYVGILREEPGSRVSFTYDLDYLERKNARPLSVTLPLQKENFISEAGLLPYFDNLVAEGWLENAQKRLLGQRLASRFELLLAFGWDCIGAVSIRDPEKIVVVDDLLDLKDLKEIALQAQRASLSGVQPKMAVIEKNGKFYPSKSHELSSHIAKFPSPQHDDIVLNEYLSTRAFAALLSADLTVQMDLKVLEGFQEPALLIQRFDREYDLKNKKYIKKHFEEFNQILNFPSDFKYQGAYMDMAAWINQQGMMTENYLLYQRILAGFLLGNTDMHFKNFALFHGSEGLRLTPSYDQVSAVLYEYKTIALEIAGLKNLKVGELKAKHCIQLGFDFGISRELINHAVKQLEIKLPLALQAIESSPYGGMKLKNKLTHWMEKRWNGTFALIGKSLSKKP